MKTFYKRLVAAIGSNPFFWLVLALFVFESVWIAVSGLYPMAFDEDFHLGIIKIYSHHLSPFITRQPPNSGAFRSVVHDPSYLYQYLMSFPYRITSWFTNSLFIQVIVLRLIDIAMMAAGLVVFRKLLAKTKARPALINLSLLFFVLTPVVPFLAAQINYDNMMIPLTAVVLLLTVRIIESLKARKPVSLNLAAGLAVLCLLTSLVKYAFLPIFLAVVFYLAFVLFRLWHKGSLKLGKFFKDIWQSVNVWKRLVWLALIVLSLFMFMQRYGVNAVEYHMIQPNCGQVLSVKECSENGPWARDFNLEKSKGHVDSNPLRFTGGWIYGLFQRSFFTVNGPNSGYSSRQFLPILGVAAAAVSILGALMFIYYRRQIFGETKFLGFLLFVAAVYLVALYLDDYGGFLRTGEMIAINGRYTFPIVLPVYLTIALGWQKFLARPSLFKLKVILPVAVFLIFITQGGGALTFIIRSDRSWYWPNNSLARDANQWTRDVFNPIVMH